MSSSTVNSELQAIACHHQQRTANTSWWRRQQHVIIINNKQEWAIFQYRQENYQSAKAMTRTSYQHEQEQNTQVQAAPGTSCIRKVWLAVHASAAGRHDRNRWRRWPVQYHRQGGVDGIDDQYDDNYDVKSNTNIQSVVGSSNMSKVEFILTASTLT